MMSTSSADAYTPEFSALVVDDELHHDTASGRAIRDVVNAIRAHGGVVIEATSFEDGRAALTVNPGLDVIVVDWDLGDGTGSARTGELMARFRARNAEVPVFLLAERTILPEIPLEVISRVNDYIWKLEDTPEFIAGRIEAAARTYHTSILPPFFGDLMRFSQVHEYSWHTPGHTGGTAFLKSPVGRRFHEFFGENLLRSDLSISVGELGSLLDHSGSIGEAERFAARVFGADYTFFSTNGSSGSNRIILGASATDGDIVLVDRNCHKSFEQALTLTGGVPIYLTPTRNRYGIIGPVPPAELLPQTIQAKIAASPLARNAERRGPVHSVITNSTYDGLCYDVVHTTRLLGQSVPRCHYDEAWYGYARFNPLYRGRYGMADEITSQGPTIITTQSTHKLLAALSQASFIHVKNGRSPLDQSRFNESFMMHSSTSPLYTIIASCDVAAKMMEGPGGVALTGDSIDEAIACRKTIVRIGNQLRQRNSEDWWFGVWQPDTICDTEGREVPFEDAPDELLRNEPRCWVLHAGRTWHGFEGLEDGYCMLDPIKFTLLTPGVSVEGSLEQRGIPAPIVTRFLDTQGIVVEKTGDYSILFLFSIGITKGKWGSLTTTLFQFKRHYDANTPLQDVFPDLVALAPRRYANLGLADLCQEMHDALRELDTLGLQDAAFSTPTTPVVSPRAAYHHLVRDEVEVVPVEQLGGRTVAVGVVPYPPGIPMLMPGENAGDSNGPFVGYLRALQEFDRRFPGFGHDTHGIENIDGTYYTCCLR
jgi:lysine decarboxylase/arginine decarboxylase